MWWLIYSSAFKLWPVAKAVNLLTSEEISHISVWLKPNTRLELRLLLNDLKLDLDLAQKQLCLIVLKSNKYNEIYNLIITTLSQKHGGLHVSNKTHKKTTIM